MKGVLSSKIKTITDQVKIVTAKAIASMVKEDELSVHHILPNIFDKNLVSTIEKAIKDQIKKG